MKRWTCDAGALECSHRPYGVDEVFTSGEQKGFAASTKKPGDPFNFDCARVNDPACCCKPIGDVSAYVPCSLCSRAPASVVSVPCGHVNFCAMCVMKAKSSQCP